MPTPLRPLIALVAAFSLSAHADDPVPVDPAVKAATDAVSAAGASLMPVSADAKTFRFTALNVAKEFNDAGLAPLAPIADKVVSIDLARTKITDAGVKALAAMKNLKEIHLENTTVTDAALDHLAALSQLEYLNLYNTKVTDAGLPKLAGLTKLKSLYLWQTGVTKTGVAALKGKLSGAEINTGWTAENDAKPVAITTPPPAAAKPAVAAAAKPADAKPAAAPAAPAATAGAKLDPAVAAKAIVYKDVIAPIIADKCVACHGVEKKKGKLQMHDFASLMKGGSDGPTTVVASKPAESLLITRIELPDDDDEKMPPTDEEKQLSKEDKLLLKWWVEQGASETMTVAAAKKTPEVEAALAALLKGGVKAAVATAPAKAEKPKARPLTEAEKKQVAEISAKMTALNASLMALAQDTEQLRLSVINAADKFGDKELALLEPIAQHVLWVDLARSQVTDAAGDTLAKMPNLERLHLENTKVTDAGIAKLAVLQNLEYLNLYGNKVTDGGIAKLEGAKGLRKLFVWQTGVTKGGAQALEGKIAGLKVNVGLSEAEIASLTAPAPAAPAAAKADAKKAAPQAATAAGSDVIKTAMKRYHKADDALCKKVSGGTAKDDELATLLKCYQDMCAATPPKGDKAAWVTKCQALIGAVKKIQAKDASGIAAYKTAVNCKACHSEHKGS
jgi:hypothetical protein